MSKYRAIFVSHVKEEFLEKLIELKNLRMIPIGDFINMDQTAIQLVPSETKTIDQVGVKQVDIKYQLVRKRATPSL